MEVIYEVTVAGLTLAVEKCRFSPNTKFVYLGILIDTSTIRFSLLASRADRLAVHTKILAGVTHRHKLVSSKLVANISDTLGGGAVLSTWCCCYGERPDTHSDR